MVKDKNKLRNSSTLKEKKRGMPTKGISVIQDLTLDEVSRPSGTISELLIRPADEIIVLKA